MRQIEQLFIEETLINELNETSTSSPSSSHHQEQLHLARSVDLYKKWKSLAGGEHHSLSFTSLQGYLTEAENFFLNTSGSTSSGGGGSTNGGASNSSSSKKEVTSNARRSASPNTNEKRYKKDIFRILFCENKMATNY